MRWLLIFIFGLSSMLNYLDRQLFAAVAPALKAEFGLTNTGYGALVSAFAITYMISAPFAGVLIDRVGLRYGATLAVAAWSLVGMATGAVRGFAGIFAVRMGLGLAEAGGIPCSSKACATYLEPSELALGNAIQSLDIALGAIAAPIVVAAMMPHYSWRAVFIVCGGLGFLWIPVWWVLSRAISSTATQPMPTLEIADIIRDKRLWKIVAASALVLTIQSLWMNWTTVYLVQVHHLTQLQANRYFAWIPPIFASLGGFTGGALALRLSRNIHLKRSIIKSRIRVCLIAAPCLLITAIVPFLHSTSLAVAGICVSFFGCTMVVININVLPIDVFGRTHAAFTSSVLVASYALVQVFLSPAIGLMVDHSSFTIVCLFLPFASLVGVFLVRNSNQFTPATDSLAGEAS
jgi:ACS family hexuronate transporter-like MFS transporter